MRYYLITTASVEKKLLFKDDEDFRQGMNYVPIVSFNTSVLVLAFILMSNHVHFVVQCHSMYEAKLFVDRFKQLYSTYYCRKYKAKEFLRLLSVDIKELRFDDESLQRGIAYVQCNCVAANITPHASLYEWGTGATFFSEKRVSGKSLSSLNTRTQQRLLRTRTELPQDYRINEDGYIIPDSYVPVDMVEKIFKSSNSYSYFLNTSSKAKLHLEKDAAPSFRDQVILPAIKDLCYSLFRAESVDQLSDEKLAGLLRELKRRFSSDAKQLARVTEMSYSEVCRLLELVS